ncbi:GAF and ANTAR domain-containing protein [Actinomycetospora sp. OC33-EN08]|uniref:GAF and ANTAR domain-containing protein n=1 Tax=Actinomycetospora aurantiaca TaxID=3129233 RepID=A0ABU8MVF6_9PSEU
MPDRPDLVLTLRNTARVLLEQRSIRDHDTVVRDVVASAVRMVPAATAGGLTRTERGQVSSSHATNETVGALDQLQTQLGEGPCIDAAENPPPDGVMLADDLDVAEGDRWPSFAPQAVKAGVRSMLSSSILTGRDGHHSALNLYADEPQAFDEDAQRLAGLFANQVAMLLYGADTARDLGAAVTSRDTIGQAKGLLMERFGLTAEEAFRMLVSASQDTNIKLVDVAAWTVHEAETRAR